MQFFTSHIFKRIARRRECRQRRVATINRHHRRYRITEGTDEIQIRRIAGYMFGYMKQRAPKGVTE